MANEHVKVYEEKKKLPIWAWLVPLLLLLALLAYLLLRPKQSAVNTAAPATTATAQATGAPDLGAVKFDTDKATLTSEGQATLTRAADYLKQNPGAKMRIEGYTDSTGNEPHNADLSAQRAFAAGHFLEGQGIERSRLTGGGFAAADPVGSNDTTAGKADNRRVEIYTEK